MEVETGPIQSSYAPPTMAEQLEMQREQNYILQQQLADMQNLRAQNAQLEESVYYYKNLSQRLMEEAASRVTQNPPNQHEIERIVQREKQVDLGRIWDKLIRVVPVLQQNFNREESKLENDLNSVENYGAPPFGLDLIEWALPKTRQNKQEFQQYIIDRQLTRETAGIEDIIQVLNVLLPNYLTLYEKHVTQGQ